MKSNSEILFATRALAEEYIAQKFPGAELYKVTCTVDNFDNDISVAGIGTRDGQCSGYYVKSGAETLAQLAWWEEGGEYTIRVNGTPVDTATYLLEARQKMKKLYDWREEDDDRVDCLTPDGEVLEIN